MEEAEEVLRLLFKSREDASIVFHLAKIALNEVTFFVRDPITLTRLEGIDARGNQRFNAPALQILNKRL